MKLESFFSQLWMNRSVSSVFEVIATVVILFLFSLLLNGCASPPVTPVAKQSAYIDPALATQDDDLSVVVTGIGEGRAHNAVRSVGGAVTSDLWLIDAVGATITQEMLEQLASMPTILSIVENKRIAPSTAVATDMPPATDVAWPVAQDVGADQLHADGITGEGITVAVIDSGVTFYKKLADGTDADVVLDYAGQFDFSEDGSCLREIEGYCFQKSKEARDLYGHGSHVAGIIGNGYRDLDSGVYLGIAPDAEVLSFRALTDQGVGSYEQTIEAIQAVSALKDKYNIRVVNLSLSATASVPYFVDPLNRAVEALWAQGIVVIAAAGNEGPNAGSITVPGNDPYIITVGGLNTKRSAGDFSDDSLPSWSATGPTADGFLKPDVLAPGADIISFMYNAENDADTAYLALNHPDYSLSEDFFSMSGTSMATAVTSGVVALMLQADPDLTPDEVKFRLMTSARPAIDDEDLAYNLLQQGAGRIWAPDAVLGNFPQNVAANTGMDIARDLAHGSEDEVDLQFHYQGPIHQKTMEDSVTLYYVKTEDGTIYALGIADGDQMWLSRTEAEVLLLSFAQMLTVDASSLVWAGGASPSSGGDVWAGGGYAWSGGGYAWSGGGYAWSGGGYAWSGGGYAWAGGGYAWSGGGYAWSGGCYTRAGAATIDTSLGSTRWVEEAEPATELDPDQQPETPDSGDVTNRQTFIPLLFTGQ